MNLRSLANKGIFFSPFALGLSLLVVRYLAIPASSKFTSAAQTWAYVLPPQLREHYDPSRDSSFNLSVISSLLGYICMGLLCTFFDLFPKITLTWKTQGNRSYFTVKEWLEAVVVSLGNMFFFSWFVTIPVLCLHRSGILRDNTPMSELADPIHIPTEIFKSMCHGLIIEVWFYTTHIALHQPPFYKNIHKMHHRFKAPTAVACMYAHPIEFTIGNVMGVILGPAVTNCHPYTAATWMCFSLIATCGSHSGYKFFSARNHDWHHEHFDYCFGTSVFMDKLLGTHFEGSEAWKKLQAKANK